MASEPQSLLGVTVYPRSRRALVEEIVTGVASGQTVVIPHHNLHSAALAQKDPIFRKFFDCYPGAHIDGMVLVLWGRLLGLPLSRDHRVTYLDLIGPLMKRAAAESWQVFHLGGAPGVGNRAAGFLEDRYGVRISTEHGYFDHSRDSESNRAVINTIRRVDPDLVLVGMGMPRQERWLLENVEELPNAVYLCSGGCFDYLAGTQKAPPRWAGAVGIEWIFRLGSQPRRLASRYLIEPFRLMPAAAADVRCAWSALRRRRST